MENLIEIIKVNINLLNEAGLQVGKVVFIEEPSGIRIQDFEIIGYKLLMIISPTECTQKIPWPIVKSDKRLYHEFLRKFCDFIKMLISNHKLDRLPNISMSVLREAKGENILRLLYKLSTLALETQLKKFMGPEEQKMMLPKPLPSKEKKVHKIKADMVMGALYEEKANLLEISTYKESAQIQLENLQSISEMIEKKNKTVKENLASAVEELEVSSEVKKTLCDLEDTRAISAYNKETKQKEEELKMACKQIIQIKDLAAETVKLANREEYCLNGQDIIKENCKMNLLPLAMSENGDVRLIEVAKSFHDEVLEKGSNYWDVESLEEKPLFEKAQEIRSVTTKNQEESFKILNKVIGTMEGNKQSVAKLRKSLCKRMKGKKLPKYIEPVKNVDSCTLNINLPASNPPVTSGKNRKSLNTVIRRRKNGSAVVCSYKNKPVQSKSTGLNYSQQDRKSLKKRNSLAMHEVPGGILKKTPKFKLPLAASTPAVLGPGSSNKNWGETSSISGISTISKSSHPRYMANDLDSSPCPSSASVFAAPKPGTSGMGSKPQATTSVSCAAAGNKARGATRRSARFKSSTVKKPNEESSLTLPGIQEPCDMKPVTEQQTNRSRPRKSLDDIIQRYITIKEKITNNQLQQLLKENDTDQK